MMFRAKIPQQKIEGKERAEREEKEGKGVGEWERNR